MTFKAGELSHLLDGPEQEERDRYLATSFDTAHQLYGPWYVATNLHKIVRL